jgi:hypothetical protein
MSEQNGTHVTAKPHLNRQASTQKITLQRPANDNKEAWKAYWKTQGQSWRTEPEICKERQHELDKRRKIKPDIKNGIYPFKDIHLNRADVEWLLSTHDNNRGPINWEDANLRHTHLEGANLIQAHLEGVDLSSAYLRETGFSRANLEYAMLALAHLEDAKLNIAYLAGAQLGGAFFDRSTVLEAIVLSTNKNDTASLADILWGDVNVAVIDWSKISILGDENEAKENKSAFSYENAARAYRQLSVVLHNQGLNEDASRFAYRAQLMQRKVFWYQHKFLSYFGSLFLDLLSGYGYRFWHSFFAYAFVIIVFAAIYFHITPHLTWYEPIVISMTAFHGRGFFSTQFNPGDPQAIVASIEAFVGLFIEITLIATLTQRLFGR